MINKTWIIRYWQLGLVGAFGIVVSQTIALGMGESAIAQIKPDPTLGSDVLPLASVDVINGGVIRGTNLFHSFLEFNVSEGRAAYFTNPAGIENILSRVTGEKPSKILGTLGVLGNANLFLINPNGIIFGPKASLNVQGSFIASTASSVNFADGTQFSTTVSQRTPLLTISVPLGLQFGENPGKILVQGDGQGTRTTNTINPLTGLYVQPNQTLALVGGDVALQGGTLKTAGGRIELGSVAGSSLVSLTPVDKGWALGYKSVQNFGDIVLSQQATVDASGRGGGDIQVQGKRVKLTGGSTIDASTLRSESGGTLNVNASESVELIGTSQDGQIQSGLFALVYSGDSGTRGGNITIKTGRLSIRDGAQVQTVTEPLSPGSGGSLVVTASDSIDLIGESDLFSSGLFTQSQGAGSGGSLTIDTKQLTVRNGAQVSASAFSDGSGGILSVRAKNIELSGTSAAGSEFPSGLFASTQGTGNAGDLQIKAEQLVVRDGAEVSVSSLLEKGGNAGILKIETGQLIIQNGAQVSAGTMGSGQGGTLSVVASDLVELTGTNSLLTTQTSSTGKGGELTIDTRRLIVQNGAQVSTGTFSQGQGGNLNVSAHDLIELTGTKSGLITQTEGMGTAGNLKLETGQLIVRDGASISASTSAQGKGGNIQLHTNSLSLANNARISSRSLGLESAGNININVRNTLQANNGLISTNATKAGGGNITINAGDIRLRNNSDIKTNSGGGDGGSIFLNANTIVALEDSDILAFAPFGRGGDIKFTTSAFLSDPLYRPTSPTTDVTTLNALEGNGRVDVNASGAVSGAITGLPDKPFGQGRRQKAEGRRKCDGLYRS